LRAPFARGRAYATTWIQEKDDRRAQGGGVSKGDAIAQDDRIAQDGGLTKGDRGAESDPGPQGRWFAKGRWCPQAGDRT
jgi:hypothetical protein